MGKSSLSSPASTVARCSHRFPASLAPCEQLEQAHCNAERHEWSGLCGLIHHHAYEPLAPSVELSGERALELAQGMAQAVAGDSVWGYLVREAATYLRAYAAQLATIQQLEDLITAQRRTLENRTVRLGECADAMADQARTIRQHEETIAKVTAERDTAIRTLREHDRAAGRMAEKAEQHLRAQLAVADRKNGELLRERDTWKAEADRRTHELNLSCKVQMDLRSKLTAAESRIAEWERACKASDEARMEQHALEMQRIVDLERLARIDAAIENAEKEG